jgi:hypothetical protein
MFRCHPEGRSLRTERPAKRTVYAARTADQPADASQRAACRQLVAKAFCRETEGRLRDN